MSNTTNNNIGERDAIHVPVIWLKAHENLSPGEEVGIDQNETAPGYIGIVNPFGLKVAKGEPCQVWLPPGSTEAVRHTWTHPKVDSRKTETTTMIESWANYVVRIAIKLRMESSDLLGAANQFVESGTDVGGWQGEWDVNAVVDWPEFWEKYNAQFGTFINSETDPFCC